MGLQCTGAQDQVRGAAQKLAAGCRERAARDPRNACTVREGLADASKPRPSMTLGKAKSLRTTDDFRRRQAMRAPRPDFKGRYARRKAAGALHIKKISAGVFASLIPTNCNVCTDNPPIGPP